MRKQAENDSSGKRKYGRAKPNSIRDARLKSSREKERITREGPKSLEREREREKGGREEEERKQTDKEVIIEEKLKFDVIRW